LLPLTQEEICRFRKVMANAFDGLEERPANEKDDRVYPDDVYIRPEGI